MRHALGVAVVVAIVTLCTQGGCSSGDDDEDLFAPECTPVPEICDFGVDNDCDGEVNEGCDCVNGEFAACYDGPPETKHVGECRDGTIRCVDGRWGACTGWTGPAVEANNCLDDDCDGETDEDFPPPQIAGCHDLRRDLGWFSGDSENQAPLVATGSQEEWLELWVTEDDHTFLQPKDLAIRITLTGAAIAEYDLVVRCINCSAPAMETDWWPHDKEVPFKVDDNLLREDHVELLIHIRRISGLACERDPWTLTITNAWERGGGFQITGWRKCP